MVSITLETEQRKGFITAMKQETKPSRRLRMHITLLLADGYKPVEIARLLYCSRTTVYHLAQRFEQEGQKAFEDQAPRGPKPLLDQGAKQRLAELVEEKLPTEHGFNRSRWTCLVLALQLFKEGVASISTETVRRALHALDFVWRRPRPIPPEKNSKEKMKRLLGVLALLFNLPQNEALMFEDETEVHLLPKFGFCWMKRGKQKKLPTPGKNQKGIVCGGINWQSKRLIFIRGEKKVSELFISWLEETRKRLRRYHRIHIFCDNDSCHISQKVEEYLMKWRNRLCIHSLPSWSPDANPMELVWLVLHNVVTRNHACSNLEELFGYVEAFLKEGQPFDIKLPEVYKPLMDSLDFKTVQISCAPI
jgi:putative transposase